MGFYFWILMFPMCSLQVSLAFLTCSSDFQCVPQDVPNSIFFIPYIYIYIYNFILILKIGCFFKDIFSLLLHVGLQ